MTQRTLKIMMAFCAMLMFTDCKGQIEQTDTANRVVKNTGNVGGKFENRELTFIGMPENIRAVDTSNGWQQKGQKLLVTGTIYKKDGNTPASNVILYYYHTDVNGLYADLPDLDRRVLRHGYIRGWVQSDAEGNYSIYTVKPGSYPNSRAPAHIHPTIIEPSIEQPYWIDEWVFDEDPYLTESERNSMRNRGGSGILKVRVDGDLQIARKDIILGLNIPNYPED